MCTIGCRKSGKSSPGHRTVVARDHEKGARENPGPLLVSSDPYESVDQPLGRKQMPIRLDAVPQPAVLAWLSEAIQRPADVRSMSAAPSPRPRVGPAWARPVDGVICPSPGWARPPVP